MLLLDLTDLAVQLPGAPVAVLGTVLLVVVVGLLLAAQQRQGVQLAERQRPVLLVVAQQPHLGVVVVLRGRAPGEDLRPALQDGVGLLALEVVEQLAVAIEVVEVLQEAEIEGFPDVRGPARCGRNTR